MSDDWEDWEDDKDLPPLPGAPKPADPEAAKFAGEDEEEDAPAWQKSVPKPEQTKEPKKKTYEDKDKEKVVVDDTPLDDPIAEKLRQQRLVEEADFQATKELFGEDISLDDFIPKSNKDFEDFGKALAQKYLLPHSKSDKYKAMMKALLKYAMPPVGLQETKDLEACLAGIRAEKIKEDNAAKNAKKAGGKKKTLNVGRSGGSAGLDDYKFDQALDDELDFM
ncbi:hypothetical protein WJX72_000930 [[Myrmecia] bisecta]|uniref:Eukaryotic translation initiation factor 3 30 kDa subunit n=1 Tax=[Myrmecia] bisecta TaxID=41462 RepID=A0AAW1R4C3_9CHLO